MRTVHAFEVLAFVVPLALLACGGEKPREAESPSNTVGYEAPQAEPVRSAVSEPSAMTPAAGTIEPATQAVPSPKQEFPEAPKAAPLTDEQIAAITDAANAAEVEAAKLALKESKNPRVKKFAQKMIDHHGKAKQDQSKLMTKLGMTPAESTKLKDLKTAASDTERTLSAAPADRFDKIYMDIQVADHQMVLDSLDRELIPGTQNADLKKALQDFRPKVEAHLTEALEIQKTLMTPAAKAGSSNTTGSKDMPKDTTGSKPANQDMSGSPTPK